MIINTNGTLTAAAEPAEKPRIVEGLIIPWDEPGLTSGGPLSAKRGSIKIPADVSHVKLLRDHSNEPGSTPVGYALEIDDTDKGLVAKFAVARTPDGDTALTDVKEKVRDALSVELINPEVSTDGNITSASLLSVALVSTPAYNSARVTHVTAARPKENTMPQANETAAASTPAAPAAPDVTATVSAPAGIVTGTAEKADITAEAIYDALTRLDDAHAPDTMLTAALKSMATAKSPLAFAPQWVGELWEGVEYKRRIVPAMTQVELTGLKLQGFRWKTKPTVRAYTGHPAEVPSTAAEFEMVEKDATRLAGANKLPIELIHFKQVDTIAKYFKACAESYAIESDKLALQEALAATTEDDRSTVKWDLFKACAFARRKINQAVNADPTVYVVSADDWFALLDITRNTLPTYLELIGATPDMMVPSELVGKGKVLAWHKSALEHAELKGSPIRVNGIDVATGATDEGVFGYRAVLDAQPQAIKLVKFSA